MQHITLVILASFFLTFALTSVTGEWFSDSQNIDSNNQPYNFTISFFSNNGSYIITYNNSKAPYNFSSMLSQDITTGAWIDENGQELFYNSTSDTVLYPTNSTPSYSLFSRNGSYFTLEDLFGYVFGFYENATLLTPDNNCSVPSSIMITPVLQEYPVSLFFDPESCWASGCLSFFLQLGVPGTSNITYIAQQPAMSNASVWFLPFSAPYKTTLEINSCIYQYDKYQGQLISGTWQVDWQSMADLQLSLIPTFTSYQLSIHNNYYMTATYIVYNRSLTVNVAPANTNSYYNPYLVTGFDYNPTYNTLTFDAQVQREYVYLMYSQNGSILDPSPFISNWSNPENSQSCCSPNLLEITQGNNSYTLQATYHFSTDLTTIPECVNISKLVVDGKIIANMTISTPSFTELSWEDTYGTNITSSNPGSFSEITVDFISGCTFFMPRQSLFSGSPLALIALLVLGMLFL